MGENCPNDEPNAWSPMVAWRNASGLEGALLRGPESDAMLRQMTLDDYKTVLYRQEDGSWVAEVPALSGCYALMSTRAEALSELAQVFELIAEEYREKGQPLPNDTTEIVNA